MNKKYQVLMMKANDLKEYANNPRQNIKAVEKVADSIKTYGWRVPIVIDEDNVILAGHTRLKAAKLLELKEVPVHVAKDLSEEQKTAFRIMDNKSQDFAEWDNHLLGIEFEKLAGGDFDLDMTGFDFKEIEVLTAGMMEFEDPESLVIDEDFEELTDIISSNIRMVQLFLNQETEPVFQEMITQLKTRWGAVNLTEAVYQAVERCSKNENL